jgi:hypothetical protein
MPAPSGGYQVSTASGPISQGGATINASTGLIIPKWFWIVLALIVPGGVIGFVIWNLVKRRKKK